MANNRLIRNKFFNDPKICGLSIEERFFLIGMICAANDYGKVWLNEANIRSIIYPTDEISTNEIGELIKSIVQTGIICKYEVENINYAHFPKWRVKGSSVFQWLDHPRVDVEIPDCPICIGNNSVSEKTPENIQEYSDLIEQNLNKLNKKDVVSLDDLKNNHDLKLNIISNLPNYVDLIKFGGLVVEFEEATFFDEGVDYDDCLEDFLKWFYIKSSHYVSDHKKEENFGGNKHGIIYSKRSSKNV